MKSIAIAVVIALVAYIAGVAGGKEYQSKRDCMDLGITLKFSRTQMTEGGWASVNGSHDRICAGIQ